MLKMFMGFCPSLLIMYMYAHISPVYTCISPLATGSGSAHNVPMVGAWQQYNKDRDTCIP